MAFCSSFGLGILHLFRQSWTVYHDNRQKLSTELSRVNYPSIPKHVETSSIDENIVAIHRQWHVKGKENSLKCMLTSIHERGISFGLLKIFLIVSTWAIEQIAVSEGLTVATLAPRRICDYSRVNMRSASIFLSLWKLHSGGQGETVAVAVRENVWEPLKLGLVSGYSRVVYLVCW